MNKQWQMRFLWLAVAGGVLIVSSIPGNSWFGRVCAPYLANNWVRFLTYAAIVALPCAAWRVRAWVLFCFAVLSAILSGLPHRMFGWPALLPEKMIPDIFGIAAGVLLGLNVRTIRHPRGMVSYMRQDRGRLARINGSASLENRPPLTLQDAVGKEKL